MKSKKGMDMSLQTVVVAALVLLILVVLILVFTGQIGNFNKSLNACEEKGYTCTSGSCDSGDRFYSYGCKDNQICCAPKEELNRQLGFT